MGLSAGTRGDGEPVGIWKLKAVPDSQAKAETVQKMARNSSNCRFTGAGFGASDFGRFGSGGLVRFLEGSGTVFRRLWDTLLLMTMDWAKSSSLVRSRRAVVAGLVLALVCVGSGFAVGQAPAAAPAVLIVEGAIATPLSLTAEDLDKMPRATATLTADGTTTTYEGVLLYDILVKAGWQFGHGMTGKGMASYVLATAKDGYQVLFSPAEVDPMFAGAKVIIADKADGAALPGREGPFRVVAPQDKMHARSIYSLVKIEVVKLRP